MVSLSKVEGMANRARIRADAIARANRNRIAVEVKVVTRPAVSKRMAELDARSNRISRELKAERMLPSNRSNQFAGWVA